MSKSAPAPDALLELLKLIEDASSSVHKCAPGGYEEAHLPVEEWREIQTKAAEIHARWYRQAQIDLPCVVNVDIKTGILVGPCLPIPKELQ